MGLCQSFPGAPRVVPRFLRLDQSLPRAPGAHEVKLKVFLGDPGVTGVRLESSSEPAKSPGLDQSLHGVPGVVPRALWVKLESFSEPTESLVLGYRPPRSQLSRRCQIRVFTELPELSPEPFGLNKSLSRSTQSRWCQVIVLLGAN